jgi:uncharacterized NAD(P)/FAD-binding protein YdhS
MLLEITVGVIGSGFAGTAFVHHLDNALSRLNLRLNVSVKLFEAVPENYGGGIAYGQANSEHVTNIPAERLSISPDNPRDFLDWCAENNIDIQPRQPAPRKIFGAYLRQKLRDVNLPIQNIFGTVTDVRHDAGQHQVILEDNGIESVHLCDFVVLATGNCGVKSHPVLGQVNSPRIIHDMWNEKHKITEIPASASVGIIGSGLTAYDVCRTLLAQQHQGKVHLISRGGNRHFAYPPIDQPFEGEIQLDRPLFVEAPTLELMQAVFEFDWYRATRRHTAERVLENWTQYVPTLIQKWGLETMMMLYRKHQSLLTTNRVGVSYEAHISVQNLLNNCKGEVIKGEIIDVAVSNYDVTLQIAQNNGTQFQSYDYVVVALGRSTESPLIQKMHNNGLVQIHPIGGVYMDDSCRVANGLYAIGALQLGHNTTSGKFIASPANSVPGARQGIQNAASEISRIIDRIDDLYGSHLLINVLRQFGW